MEFEYEIIIRQFDLFYYIKTMVLDDIHNPIKDVKVVYMHLNKLYAKNQLKKIFHIGNILILLMDMNL